ncbi:peptidylprolyl isomerase [Raphidocelis subcapitata]|uniref:peptidylprolyl isomerase n=1 Tax=Raphidocelis subcapitata TaxID=307507 RepID=A0A2V0PCJ8_9CHLO|nr:peptidylprolyl isomerase [Raphidocelis subcapitata]|eukprot:GBF97566.1 peptidylprolyl isomerase [Raphidocelis subcapitata]
MKALNRKQAAAHARGSRAALRPGSVRSALLRCAALPPQQQQQQQQRQRQQHGEAAPAQDAAAAPRSRVLRAAAALALAAATAAAASPARPARAESIVSVLRDGGRDIVKTASGVSYTETATGTGAPVASGDLVMLDLALYLEDGSKVLDTRDTGVPVGIIPGGPAPTAVTEGLDEVVRSMRAGSTRLAVVPAALGYGPKAVTPRNATGQVPANSALFYELELLRCQGTPVGLACCSEAKFGERGGVCIPEETLEQLEKMMGPGS